MNQQVADSDLLKPQTVQSPVTTVDRLTEGFKQLDDDVEVNEFPWDSNRKNENPVNLPWPAENESKD